MGTVEQNSLTPNSRICEALEPYKQVLLKTTTQYNHCKQKTWNAYGAGTMGSSKEKNTDMNAIKHAIQPTIQTTV